MTNQPPPEQPYGQQPGPQQPGQGQPGYQGQPGQPGQQYGPPPGWQQPQPPAKKRRGCLIAAIVVVLVVLIGAVSCVAIVASGAKSIDDQSKQEHTVLYEVTGTGKALSIVYSSDAQGSSGQEADAPLPWSKTVKIAGLLRIYTLTATNGMDSTGEIACKITVDGKVVKTATAKGAAASASCTFSE